MSQDNMVDNIDAYEFAGILESYGDLPICPRGKELTRWMVMCDNDRCCFVLDGRIKHFSWVYKTLVERTDTDSVGVDDPAGTIEGDSDEVFPVEMMILV